VGAEGPRRRPDDQADQGQSQGPPVQAVHQLLKDVPSGESAGVRCELKIGGRGRQNRTGATGQPPSRRDQRGGRTDR
jgi:hypothetical protein